MEVWEAWVVIRNYYSRVEVILEVLGGFIYEQQKLTSEFSCQISLERESELVRG